MPEKIQSQDEVKQNIIKKAANYTEANVYSLNNTYLNSAEKQEVELWFQLPGNIMFYTFIIVAIYSIYNPLAWSKIISTPIVVNIIIGILNWYYYNKKLTYNLYLTILHGWVLYLVGIGSAIFLFFQGAIILGIISLVYPFGLLSFAELHMIVYSILSKKYGMHPKFAFFKKEYGYKFPFEET
ncbi:MAG: hypothetical protein Q8N21_03620 [bacterium]|nr:hypothetical protein [bacterium]